MQSRSSSYFFHYSCLLRIQHKQFYNGCRQFAWRHTDSNTACTKGSDKTPWRWVCLFQLWCWDCMIRLSRSCWPTVFSEKPEGGRGKRWLWIRGASMSVKISKKLYIFFNFFIIFFWLFNLSLKLILCLLHHYIIICVFYS